MIYRKLKTHQIELIGKKVFLRPFTEEDWDLAIKWNNDPQVLRFSEGEDKRSWVFAELQQLYRAVSRESMIFVIEIKAEKKQRKNFPRGMMPIGDIWLQRIKKPRWLRRSVGKELHRLPVMIGEKTEWGRGYGSEAIGLVTEYALAEGADGVMALDVADYNQRCLASFRKNGFVELRRRKGKSKEKAAWLVDLLRENNMERIRK
jgi:ribosomal-protein-alanine N-acetyltransferase